LLLLLLLLLLSPLPTAARALQLRCCSRSNLVFCLF